MANKRYDEFALQTPDPERIWLHADPGTGELKGAPMKELTGCLFSKTNLINANNTGSNPQVITTLTIPAAFFDAVGSYIEVVSIHEVLNTTGPPQFNITIQGSANLNVVGSAAGTIRIYAYIQRISTTQLKYTAFSIRVLSLNAVTNITTVNIAQGVDVTVTINQTAGGANTVLHLLANGKVFSI